jgi:hypothetical protein
VKLTDMLVHDPQSTNVVDLVGVEDQRPRLDRFGRTLSRLGPTITVNHRSVNKDRWLGIIAECEGKIYGRASSRPQSTNVVDLVGVENQRPRLKESGKNFSDCEIELSDKERAYWDSTIVVNHDL